jgi:acetoin utilization deacetylase AcuC-like enzyme
MYIVFAEKCLEYWAPMHVEAPERVYRTRKLLEEKGFRFLKPEPCSEEDLLLVHSKKLIEKIKSGKHLDADTPNLPGMYDYARLSAGAAVKGMEAALKGDVAFSLMRPPGHHTGVNGRALGASTQGFCYFNNVAVACRKALKRVEKAAIVDIDCHHGNGTQEIFLGDPAVLFVSLHRYGLVYPGTGESSEQNCLNYPFTHRAGDAEYLDALKHGLERVTKFDPDLIAVSAGFDTNRFDPMHMFDLTEDAYVQIGGMISELNRPTFCVLEGGYGPKMPKCIYNFLAGLTTSE